MLAHKLRRSSIREDGSVSLVYTTSSIAVNDDVWTLNDIDLGDAPTGLNTRHLVFVVTFADNDETDETMSLAATLDGQAISLANFRVEDEGTGANNTAGVWIGIIEKPTGTIGDFVATVSGFGGTMDCYGIAVYRAINLDSATPTTTPTANDTDDITLVVPANGFGVAGATDWKGTQVSVGDFDGAGAVNAYSGTRAGAAMLRTASGSVEHSASGATVLVGATWEFI
jgi:hypothetical protein